MNTNILMSTSISMCMIMNTLMKARNICMNMSIRENMVRMTMNKRGTRKNLIPTIIDG